MLRELRWFWLLLVLAVAGCSTGGSSNGVRSNSRDQAREAASANTQLGQSYMKQGKYEVALQKLQRALALDPDFVDAHTVIAVLYENIGDSKQAEQHYRRASQLKPKGGDEANNYGTFLCKLQRPEEAEKYFQIALADPFYQTPDIALVNAGTCFAGSGKYDAAERTLRTALERRPDNADALFQMANVQYGKGEFLLARAFMQRLDATGAIGPDALLLGRNIEAKLNNAQGAADFARRLLRDFPKSPQANSLRLAQGAQ
ncbi:MAG: type IV pilus biogenesis/stability protein PilW [Dokdonella sp.]